MITSRGDTQAKKKEGSCIKKSWQIQTTFADFATAKIPFKCIYLYLWQESKEKRRKMKWERRRWHRNENKSKAARGEDRENDREWHNSHVRMKECCLYATCQLILLLFEISAPEQTSQGQTTAHSSIIKVSGLCRSNTCAAIMFHSLCVTTALKQAYTHCWMRNQNVNITILKLVRNFGHLVF